MSTRRRRFAVATVAVLGFTLLLAARYVPAQRGGGEEVPQRRSTIEPEFEGRLESCCDSVDAAGARGIARDFQVADVPEGSFVPESVLESMKESVRFDPDVPEGRALGETARGGGVTGEGVGADEVAAAGPRPRLKRNFDGLDRASASHDGFIFFPPDTIVAVNRQRVLEGTNSALRMSTRGDDEVEVQSLNDHFGVKSPPFLFDPKVYFDPMSERFFVVAVSMEEEDRNSWLYLSVSRSEIPETLSAPDDWCNYRIKTKRGASWADFPGLGMNGDWVGISVNNFRFNGEFKTPFIYALDREALVDNSVTDPDAPSEDGCPSLEFFRFRARIDAGDELAFTIQPAQHFDDSDLEGNPLFFLSSRFGSENTYVLWRIEERHPDDGSSQAASDGQAVSDTIRGRLTRDGKPVLSSVLIEGEDYSLPPDAEQPQGGLALETGDNRVLQVVFRDGVLWGAFATGCSLGTFPNESCVRAVSILPDDEAGGAVLFEETFGDDDGRFIWNPGIAVNRRGDVVVPFQRSAGDEFLGTAFNGKRVRNARFSGFRRLADGDCRLSNVSEEIDLNRTGDYVGAGPDPRRPLHFWIAGEYAGSVPRAGGCDWRTRIARVKF